MKGLICKYHHLLVQININFSKQQAASLQLPLSMSVQGGHDATHLKPRDHLIRGWSFYFPHLIFMILNAAVLEIAAFECRIPLKDVIAFCLSRALVAGNLPPQPCPFACLLHAACTRVRPRAQ